MMNLNEKLKYLLFCAYNYFNKIECPYCSQNDVSVIDRKFIVARLIECNNCHLYFIHPLDDVKVSNKFYQNSYEESDNITTVLPSYQDLQKLIKNQFNPDKNANRFISLFKALLPQVDSPRIIDYGASWGYTSYQFKKAA